MTVRMRLSHSKMMEALVIGTISVFFIFLVIQYSY